MYESDTSVQHKPFIDASRKNTNHTLKNIFLVNQRIHLLVDILGGGGGFWVEVRFIDYSSRLNYMHIYFEFWLWEVSVIYWEQNPL